MICKWCGATADVTKGTCPSCGKELPPLSDCGGFYDIVPEAARKASAPEPAVQEWNAPSTEKNTTQPLVASAMPMQGEPQVVQIRPRSGGRVLFVIPIVLLLVAVLVVSLLLASANRENDELMVKIESLEKDNDKLNDEIDKLERDSDRKNNDNENKPGNNDIQPGGNDIQPGDDVSETTNTETTTEPTETTSKPAETTTEPAEPTTDSKPDGEENTPNFSTEELSFSIDLTGERHSFRCTSQTDIKFVCLLPKEDDNEWTANCKYKNDTAWTLKLTTADELKKGDKLTVSYDIEDVVNFGKAKDVTFKWEYLNTNGEWATISLNLDTDDNTSTYTISDYLTNEMSGEKACYFRCTITRKSEEGELTIEVIWSVPAASTST